MADRGSTEMTEKSGFLGLGAAGGVAAGAATLVVLVGALYATGVLAPADDATTEPTEVAGQSPTPSEPESEAPASTQTTQVPSTVAESPEPAEEAPAADTSEPTEVAEEPETTEDTETAAGEPKADEASEPASADQPADFAEDTTQPETETPLSAPRFDVVRASPDGTTVIAGKAGPGSTVLILVDGEVADTQPTNSQGEFASLLLLPPSTQARVLTLLSTQGTREALSAEEIIIAPTSAPQVAAVEPEPAPEPETIVATNEQPVREAPAEVAQTETAIEAPQPTETQTETETPAQADVAEDTAALTEDAEPAAEPVTEATSEQAPSPSAEPETQAEPAAVAVLRADEEGVELVQPATPTSDVAPDQVTLDTIGYSPEGDVLLSGRAQSESLIRVYLNNTARADVSTRSDGGWRARLDDIAPGVYTLRLDALSSDGAVLSRLETPFKRESPEALASAQPEAEASAEPAPISQVTVQAGDTLWAISRERYGDGLLFIRVFEANRDAIRNPDLIYPGQIFTIPE